MGKRKENQGAVLSMTGYGRAAGEFPWGRVTVEVRSLNHRYLEIAVRSPKGIFFLEPEVRRLVRDRVSRGKVEVFLSCESTAPDFRIDRKRAGEVAQGLADLASMVGDTVRLEHILAVGEITNTREMEIPGEMSQAILDTLAEALDRMLSHRRTEGQALGSDLVSRIGELEGKVSRIEGLAPQVPDRVRRQLESFLESVNTGSQIDPQRLEAEIAILAQKSDVTEEITRLKTHLAAFRMALSFESAVGRRMDFLLQEMQREINTIGSKSSHPDISGIVVDFKTDMEKVREQIQNIE